MPIKNKLGHSNNPDLPASFDYSKLVEQNEAGILLLHNDIIQYANPAFLEILSSTKSSLVGLSILDFIVEEDQKILALVFERIIAGNQQVSSHNLQLSMEDNSLKYISLHLRVSNRTLDGKVEIVGSSRDSTRRVIDKRDAETNRRRYEALYENIVEGIIVYDYLSEETLACNNAAVKILGYDSEEEIKSSKRFNFIPKTSVYFPGQDLHEVTKGHGELVVKGQSFKTPGVFIKKDQSHILVSVNVVPTFVNKGVAFVVFSDVTKKVLNAKALKKSETKYKDIFENSHEAIIYSDLTTRKIIDCNGNAVQLFGYASVKALLDSDPLLFFKDTIIEGTAKSEFYEGKIKEALENGRTKFTFKAHREDDELLFLEATMVADLTDKRAPKMILFARDITKIYLAQQTLNDKNEELQKYIDSNLQLENFAYFASHDLQTPLRSIISFTQLLKGSLGKKLSENELEYMAFIIKSGKNMRSLIDDLLTYSRVNNSKTKLEQVNLPGVLADLETEFLPTVKKKKAVIVFEDIPQLIEADYTKIRQLFQNLIGNALKFTAEETTPVVKVSCTEIKDYWRFCIEDNGIGIDKTYQDRIFLLFKRLHSNDQFEGTGIGLAMCKKIVDQHNGKIWLQSNEGEGCKFYFTILKKHKKKQEEENEQGLKNNFLLL